MPTSDLVCATVERFVLAEGPMWDPVHGLLLWIDVERGLVLAGDLRADGRITVVEALRVGETVGAVAPAATGDWVVAGAQRLHVRASGGALAAGRRLLPAGSGRRLNDAKPDPAGRLVVGTLPLAEGSSTTEELLLVRPDRVDRIDGDLTLSNGLAWSLDGGTMYSVDTLRCVINRRPWDPAAGTWGVRTPHVTFNGEYPDGICLDAEDHLWVAMYGLGEVRRYAPDGVLVSTIRVPAPHTTSVAFAGPDRTTLVITTGSRDLDAEGRARHPDGGALFTVTPGVRGKPEALWSGTGAW